MSKKKAIYKYKAVVKHRLWREHAISTIPFAIYLVVCIVRPIMPVFIVGFVISSIVSALLFAKHGHIAIFSRYFVMGDTVILYRNISKLFVTGGSKSSLQIETRNGGKFVINMNKFTSNARKSWKVEANQKKMFNKVITKILQKCSESSKSTLIRIKNYPDLKSFQQG